METPQNIWISPVSLAFHADQITSRHQGIVSNVRWYVSSHVGTRLTQWATNFFSQGPSIDSPALDAPPKDFFSVIPDLLLRSNGARFELLGKACLRKRRDVASCFDCRWGCERNLFQHIPLSRPLRASWCRFHSGCTNVRPHKRKKPISWSERRNR